MQIATRIAGLATSILWVFLLLFSVTAVYSIKDLQFSFGEPKIIIATGNELIFSLPINVSNNGYYNIGLFNVTTEITDTEGLLVSPPSSTVTPTIGKGQKVTILHNTSLNFQDLLNGKHNYLFNDTELKVAVSVGMKIAELIPVQASANLSIPWGAPLFNLTVGETEHIAINLTHVRVVIQVVFENHAFFDVSGNLRVCLYDGDILVAENQTAIEAPQHSPYKGYVELCVPAAAISSAWHFEMYVLTPFFNYGPWNPYGK